jgi:ankyrin repeat protein
MSYRLPERPDLSQLRRQAKELRDAARRGDPAAAGRIARRVTLRAGAAVTLSAAQLVIARECGFAGWPQLKAEVEARAGSLRQRAEEFLAASLDGRSQHAQRLLDTDPRIARVSVFTAAVLGDAAQVRELITHEPMQATTPHDRTGWPPLLYVCYSPWHRIDPAWAAGMTEVAQLLLDAGASPGTSNGGRPHHGYRSALHGTVTVNNPAITQLLLERGARPDDGESLYQAAVHRDHACLRLMLTHGATVDGTWALEVASHGDDAAGVRLLLEAAAAQATSAGQLADLATSLLPGESAAITEALLQAGADPDAPAARQDGISPMRRAVREGRQDLAAMLLRHGVHDDSTEADRFLGACLRGDRGQAERLLAGHSGLADRLSEADRAVIVEAAWRADTAAVRLLLELGFSASARNDFGETALHSAAGAGRADLVRLLLAHGAQIDARESNWNSTPLTAATVGSGEHTRHSPGADWIATIRTLLDAGAARDGAWIPDMPPSEEVAALLHTYGITGDRESGLPAAPGQAKEQGITDPPG